MFLYFISGFALARSTAKMCNGVKHYSNRVCAHPCVCFILTPHICSTFVLFHQSNRSSAIYAYAFCYPHRQLRIGLRVLWCILRSLFSGGIPIFNNRFSRCRTDYQQISLIIKLSWGKPRWLAWYKCKGCSSCCQQVQSSKGNCWF